jgi:hypothetical protein
LLQRLADLVYGLKEDGITPKSIQNDIIMAEQGNDETIDIARLKRYSQTLSRISEDTRDQPA